MTLPEGILHGWRLSFDLSQACSAVSSLGRDKKLLRCCANRAARENRGSAIGTNLPLREALICQAGFINRVSFLLQLPWFNLHAKLIQYLFCVLRMPQSVTPWQIVAGQLRLFGCQVRLSGSTGERSNWRKKHR